ncbi:MAG: transferase [Deltaproteobacteria bacterium]|nr:transferase [Deltaproteobacteria bacterium]
MRAFRSRGDGSFTDGELGALGEGVVIEAGVRIFHPRNVFIGDNVYVGHGTVLEGYHDSRLAIGSDTWIGAGCHLHAAGGLTIGATVGIGPGVRIITSTHRVGGPGEVILEAPITFAPVVVGDGCDLGVSSVILPGVSVGEHTQVGAGAVVTRDLPPHSVAAGVPARVLRSR